MAILHAMAKGRPTNDDVSSSASVPMRWVTRFAPSPTGFLHLGHAAAAHTAWRRARESGGRFLLRIEDIDPERCRPPFDAAILDDLAWLGLDWDGPVLRQSDRLPLYRDCLNQLRARGLLYPCFCSRAEIRASMSAPHADDGTPLYPGTCRRLDSQARETRLSSGAAHAWRLDIARALADAPSLRFVEEGEGEILAHPEQFGDVVLARRDAPASYHLCVTFDDAAQDVSLVTRGDDLKPATHLHRLLQHLMGWPTPVYTHHALVRDDAGRRLSKREGNGQVCALRQAGLSAAAVWSRAGLVENEPVNSPGYGSTREHSAQYRPDPECARVTSPRSPDIPVKPGSSIRSSSNETYFERHGGRCF